MIMSCDLGGQGDPTAVSILNPIHADRIEVPHLERFPLGVSYAKQYERIVQLVHALPIDAVVIDATGAGLPQLEELTARLPGVPVTGIMITSGSNVGGSWSRPTVPKRTLVSALQVVVEHGRLKVAPSPTADAALTEFAGFKYKYTSNGNEISGNGRESQHDDIVLSLAMGVWYIEARGGSVGAYVPADRPAVNAGGIIDSLLRQGVDASEIPRWFGRR
jgi:hypothetical protein